MEELVHRLHTLYENKVELEHKRLDLTEKLDFIIDELKQLEEDIHNFENELLKFAQEENVDNSDQPEQDSNRKGKRSKKAQQVLSE